MKLVDGQGRGIRLGQQLGSGGEGAVFELADSAQDVAKVYHQPASPDKAAKVGAMVRGRQPALGAVAAWPTGTLHDKAGGPIRGLIMPKVANHREIHHLYGPAHRKQDFPKADWAFLIHAARNVASAFDTIHAYGHVVGDVNQGNVLVAADATCKLIDCDSFQISGDGTDFLCEVGVPQFTPPELQGRAFRGMTRTADHDNFGLAVLCFHLLFMGRHPFAGRFSGSGDMPIEKAIREYRFAFGRSAATKQMAPPPSALALTAASGSIANLFERAFGEPASRQMGRPTAREWLSELEGLGRGLRGCANNPMHKYHPGSLGCPWCELEKASGAHFFLAISVRPTTAGGFDLNRVWATIIAIPSPGPLPTLVPRQTAHPVPTPLPPVAVRARKRRAIRLALFMAATAALVLSTLISASFLVLVVIGVVAGRWLKVDDGGEGQRRKADLVRAMQQWKALQERWTREAGDAPFVQKRADLDRLRKDYESLSSSYKKGKTDAILRYFLEQQFVDRAKIAGIGKGLKMTLISYGIETAADITTKAIIAVPGFGPKRAADLVKWRADLEASFHRNAHHPVTGAAVAGFEKHYAQTRLTWESSLVAGAEDLERLKKQILERRDRLKGESDTLWQLLTQARADAAIL